MACKLLVFVLLCFTFSRGTDITFKNVTIAYRWHGEKHLKLVPFSNSLKDFLPEIAFDKIEIKGQRIPVLYKDSLADLVDLDELVIEDSQVNEIRPGALKNVQLLRRLSLKGNGLEEIPEGVFNNLELSSLDLSSNGISSIEDGAFDNMPNLLNINLADNKIAAWNKNWFHNTPLLSRISMQTNLLDKIPQEAFKNLKGKKYFGSVDLTLNLIFSHNKIKTIHPDAFKGIDQIQNLWLDYNLLQSFEGNFLNNVEVADLRIDNNNIVCLQGDYEMIFKAQTTHIDANPFDCECLDKIKKWVDENKKDVKYFYADMTCATKRIRERMDALQKRLKEVRISDEDAEIIKKDLNNNPIK